MFKAIHIENFRCIRSLDLSLEPLTVLVGPNGVGKSAILDALNPQRAPTARDQRNHEQSQISRTWTDEHGNESRAVANRMPPISGAHATKLIHLDLQQLRAAVPLHNMTSLPPNGAHLVNLFASQPKKVREEISATFCALVPMFQDVDSGPYEGLNAGQHALLFQDRWAPEVRHRPDEVSDGSMLVLAFLMMQYEQPPLALLQIEELERGLHPYLLDRVVRVLRGLTDGSIGDRKMQIILATHSPAILDTVSPEEVRFLGRDPEDGNVIVREAPVHEGEVWHETLEAYEQSLGGIWLSGSLGGVGS